MTKIQLKQKSFSLSSVSMVIGIDIYIQNIQVEFDIWAEFNGNVAQVSSPVELSSENEK